MALAPDPRQPTARTAAAPTTSGKKTVTYTIAKGSKPAAPTTAAASSGGSLPDLASTRAAADTNAEIAGLRALQDYANQQGLLRATQQGQLGLATSKYLEGLDLPGRTTSDYAAAAAAQRAAAQGYSGGLQQTVTDAADAVQRNLAATGSPQTAYNQGEAAGNALYALGGTLPATQFGVTGPTVAASLRALPAQALGYGQQLALGQLGAGQQEAAKYNADIAGALAKQPTLAASYLDSLLAAQAKAQADAETAAWHNATLTQRGEIANATLQQRGEIADATLRQRADIANQKATLAAAPKVISAAGGIYAWNPNTGTLTTMKEPPVSAAGLPKFQQFGDTLYQVTPQGLSPVATKDPAPTTPHTKVVSDSTGQWLIDSATGARISKVGGPSASSPSIDAGTAVSRLDPSRSAYTGVATDQYGSPINYGTKAKPAYHISPGWHWGKNGQPVKNTKSPESTAYKIPAGALASARKIAEIAYGGTTTNPITGLLTGATSARKPYQEALRRVSASLRAAGVPERLVTTTAREIVMAAGYPAPPPPPTSNFFFGGTP